MSRLLIFLLPVMLLAACGSGNTTNEAAGPPLMSAEMRTAIKADDAGALEALLDAGESPDAISDEDRWPAIRLAAQHPKGDCVELLIARGADVNAKTELEGNALATAVLGGHVRSTERLLNAGAVWSFEDWSPLSAAVMSHKADMVRFFLDRGSKPLEDSGALVTPLHAASARVGTDILTILIERLPRGANIDVPDAKGYTPLSLAVLTGDDDAVELLLRAGADPKRMTANGGLLHLAAVGGGEKVFGALVRAGADIEARDSSLRTPLLTAALFGRTAILKSLIASGADLSARDVQENTALHCAARGMTVEEETRLECIEALLEAGADRTIKNDAGETPFDVASTALVRHALRIE